MNQEEQPALQHETNIVATQALMSLTDTAKTTVPRTVAMINVDVLNPEGEWFNHMTTLIDSCGCENGINSNFARMKGFKVQTEEHQRPTALSACGGVISFDEHVVVQLKMGEVYIWEKFYLMDNLPRTLLLRYPFCEKTGAVLVARAGTFFIIKKPYLC